VADPSIIDWVTVVSSVLATLATVGALWVGAIAFKRQAETQRHDQASRVSVAKTGPREVVIRKQSDRAIHYVSGFFHDGADPKIARYANVPCDSSEDVVAAGQEITAHATRVPEELEHSAIPYVESPMQRVGDGDRGRGGELRLIRKRSRRP